MDWRTCKKIDSNGNGKNKVKNVFYALSALLFVLIIYVVTSGSSTATSRGKVANTEQKSEQDSLPTTQSIIRKKNCACCAKKLSPAQEKAKQRQLVRETWARQMLANHVYEEGMKRIAFKFPYLANQMQRILEREKQLGQTPTDLYPDVQ